MYLEKIYNWLGLAQKAGKIISGTELVEKNLLRGQTKLLLLAADAAAEVKKNLLSICEKKRITVIILGNKNDLGACVGKGMRIALSLNDSGFAKAIMKEVRKENDGLNHVEVVEWAK